MPPIPRRDDSRRASRSVARMAQRRLETVGVRSINNVVDATNWVMLELNQPMHAYDAAKLHWGRLIVRRAITGERLVTLDGVERTLTDEMVAIADPEGVIGVAGVMGGASTEVSNETQDVLLEGAYWDPATHPADSPRAGPPHRGELPLRARDRSLGRGRRHATLSRDRARHGRRRADRTHPSISGRPRPILRASSFVPRASRRCSASSCRGQRWNSISSRSVRRWSPSPRTAGSRSMCRGGAPTCSARSTSSRRSRGSTGTTNFPRTFATSAPGSLPDAPVEAVISLVRRGMVAQGLYEVVESALGPADGDDSVRLVNPLSAEDGYLRRRLLPGLVRLVERNWANHVPDVRLFEIGTAFGAAPAGQRPSKSGGWPRS